MKAGSKRLGVALTSMGVGSATEEVQGCSNGSGELLEAKGPGYAKLIAQKFGKQCYRQTSRPSAAPGYSGCRVVNDHEKLTP